MGACKEYILRIKDQLPELCTVRDLIRVGIYRTTSGANMARMQKRGPEYLKIPGRGVVYPREGVINFMEKTIHEESNEFFSEET